MKKTVPKIPSLHVGARNGSLIEVIDKMLATGLKKAAVEITRAPPTEKEKECLARFNNFLTSVSTEAPYDLRRLFFAYSESRGKVVVYHLSVVFPSNSSEVSASASAFVLWMIPSLWCGGM